MKALFIDPFGDALDLAMRSKAAGHDVKMFLGPSEKYRLIGRGLVERVFDYQSHLMWADFIFLADNMLHLRVLDKFREEHPEKIVFGPTKETAAWETDRLLGMKILEDHGIECPPTKLCKNYGEAVAYVKKRDARLVCKPCGDADKALSYCSKGPEDMLFMLKKWDREGQIKDRFILQDFIPGIEFAVSGWVGEFGFGGGWFENFEHKKLMAGDIGPNTGEMGTTILATDRSKLASRVLQPLEKALIKAGYLGCTDVNCIVDEKGKAWPLEFTNRPGYPALSIEIPLYPEDPLQWMMDLALGKKDPEFLKDTVSCGVSLCLPPFPYPSAPKNLATGIPIMNMTPSNRKHYHAFQVQASNVPGTEWMTAGEYAMVVTGISRTVSGAMENTYRRLKQLTIPGGAMYRNDIGRSQAESLPKLKSYGLATAWEY
jgi:phosphoribosylamine--glycine ligase